MNLDEAISFHNDESHTLEIGELVGGPCDGALVVVIFEDYNVYGGAVYQKTFRQSSQHYQFYCFDHIGYWNEPHVRKLVETQEGWRHEC